MPPFPSFFTPAQFSASLLNRLLRRQPWARERLQGHAGKTVGFVLGSAEVRLTIGSDGCVQRSDPAVVPDVSLAVPTGKLLNLPSVLQENDPEKIIALMQIQGDAGLAHAVADLARGLRWDVEDDLARVVGDVAAVRLVSSIRALRSTVSRSSSRVAENFAEYLSEESGQVTSSGVFQDWCAHLQAANGRVQALEQDIAQLEHRLAALRADRTPPC